MDKYYPLKNIRYMENEKAQLEEFQRRISSFSTYTTGIEIKPMDNGKPMSHQEALFIVNIPELAKINEEVIENSKAIQLLIKDMPPISVRKFMENILINELQSTNEVEGVHSSKKELAEILADIEKGNKISHKRFFGLVQLYNRIEEDEKITKVEDFRSIYDKLVANEIKKDDQPDGDMFRKEIVFVKDGMKVRHTGVTPEYEIFLHLAKLLQLNENDMPDLYKYLIGHYLFEYIHPFYDGNGRLGRYILCKNLQKKLGPHSAFTFSYMINRNRSDYYQAFEEASSFMNKGEMTFFVLAMLKLIRKGQMSILTDLQEKNALLHSMLEQLKTVTSDALEYELLEFLTQSYLFQSPYNQITAPELEALLKIGRRKLNAQFEKLEQQNIITKIKKNPVIYTLNKNFVDTLFR
ncbi:MULTISPECIES: Fic family protein [unclassified Listeria]|uniref:Fic family protein n=1 Tax=unclassified Listeria TaxID=2642072 RepID=UPI000B5924F1|nr:MULTISPECIES: Fic family protein [unclassified Listeria]